MKDYQQKLTQIINLSQQFSRIKDVDILLERILKEARNLSNADAGSIYVKEEDQLKFSYTQNDTLQKRLSPDEKLLFSSFSISINHQSISGYVASTGNILNIPNVYNLDSRTPYSFNKKIDEKLKYTTKSMLCIPLTHGDQVIGVIQLINAIDDRKDIVQFPAADEPIIIHFANIAALAIEQAQLTRDILLRMIKMTELRDSTTTDAHVNRVAAYTVEIFEQWSRKKGSSQKDIDREKDILRMASMLHDVGKVSISDAILRKPARYEPEEFEIMKKHTYVGSRLFFGKHSAFDKAASIVTLNHHERWDGNGYPGHIDLFTSKPLPDYENKNGKARGKKGEEIPLYGRLVALADVYDALSNRRVYKEAWEESRVLETIYKESGKHFDPEIVDAFFPKLDAIRNISERYPDKFPERYPDELT